MSSVLLADMDVVTFIGGFVSAVVALGGAVLAWYLSVRKDNREDSEEQVKLDGKRQRASDARDRKIAAEWRDLYIDVRKDLSRANRHRVRCDKRVARLEAAILAAGIPLPPEPELDDDSEVEEHDPGTGE